MCQMPNIWHICHTKHKNGALWDVPNLKNYTTWLQYRCKFVTVQTDVTKVLLFYIPFSLSSLLSLHFFFSLLSHSPVPSLFDQSRMFTINDDGVAPTTTARSVTLDLAPTTRSHPCFSHSISLISPRGHRRSHLEATVDLTFQPLCLSLVVGFFFFFFLFIYFFRCNLG